MGEATLKLVKLFIVSTQADLHPKFPCQIGPPVHSAIYWLCLPFFQLEHHWAAQLSSVFVGPAVHIGLEDIFHSGWGNVPIPLPGQDREGSLQALLNFLNKLSGW